MKITIGDRLSYKNSFFTCTAKIIYRKGDVIVDESKLCKGKSIFFLRDHSNNKIYLYQQFLNNPLNFSHRPIKLNKNKTINSIWGKLYIHKLSIVHKGYYKVICAYGDTKAKHGHKKYLFDYGFFHKGIVYKLSFENLVKEDIVTYVGKQIKTEDINIANRKKRILFTAYGEILGHTIRIFALAREAIKQGYEVAIMGNGKYLNSLFSNYKIYHVEEFSYSYFMRHINAGNWSYHSVMSALRFVNSEAKVFEEFQPDIVVSDNRKTVSVTCKIYRIPLVAILNLSWTKYSSLIENTKENDNLYPYNNVLKKYYLNPIIEEAETLSGNLNIVPDIEEFSPRKNLPNNYKFIGPLVCNDILSSSEIIKFGKRFNCIVYITTGSTGSIDILSLCSEIINNNPDIGFIYSGRKPGVEISNSNLLVKDFVSIKDFEDKINLVICQGGAVVFTKR